VWRNLANTLEIYDHLLQHAAHVDIAVGPVTGKHDVIHKTGSTLRSEEDRATAPDNTYRKFREVRTCGF